MGIKYKIRLALVKFADTSTIHGFKDLNDTSNTVFKITWTLALCGSIALFGFQTMLLIGAYLEEKTAISINTALIDDTKRETLVYCSDDWINLQ